EVGEERDDVATRARVELGRHGGDELGSSRERFERPPEDAWIRAGSQRELPVPALLGRGDRGARGVERGAEAVEGAAALRGGDPGARGGALDIGGGGAEG